jgi:hypothetical protein
MKVVSESYQNYQNCDGSNQLTDAGRGEGCEGDSESVDLLRENRV